MLQLMDKKISIFSVRFVSISRPMAKYHTFRTLTSFINAQDLPHKPDILPNIEMFHIVFYVISHNSIVGIVRNIIGEREI